MGKYLFYYKDLEEVVFNMHETLGEEVDELVIISGYLGPSPVERLSSLPFKSTVIGGMYANGIDFRLLEALKKAKRENKNLEIEFSTIEIHSKIYIWRKKTKIITALIGSANFSSYGLRMDMRESLAVVNRGTYSIIESYLHEIRGSSIYEPPLKAEKRGIDFNCHLDKEKENQSKGLKVSCDISLFRETKDKGKYVPDKSGLNWGLSSGHVAEADAYIRIPKDILKENQGLIFPFDEEYVNKISRKSRQSDPIELIWDDGFIMPASLEGRQTYNGRNYPKQLTSYSNKKAILSNGEKVSAKSILGRYLRKRLSVPIDHQISLQDLHRYGRDNITLSLIEEGIYYADFSVK